MENRLYCESVEFGAKILSISDFLSKDLEEFIISKHLIHSGLHIGAFISEAFSMICLNKLMAIEKLNFALQYCSQTIFWLDVLCETRCRGYEEIKELNNKCNGIKKMISSILMIYKNSIDKC